MAPAIENKVVVFLTRKKVFFGVVLGCHLTVMNGKKLLKEEGEEGVS